MKIFEFKYPSKYGSGCGIVVAKTKRDAIRMVFEKYKCGDGWNGPVRPKDIILLEVDAALPHPYSTTRGVCES